MQGYFGLLDALVGQALQLDEVPRGNGSSGQVVACAGAALVEQPIQLVNVAASIGQVGEPVEGDLVAGICECPEDAVVALADARLGLDLRHTLIVQPSPYWKVKPQEVPC